MTRNREKFGEQISRVFVNLIKNSEESLAEKKLKIKDFKGKIHLDIKSNNDYIDVTLIDNGTGISDTKKIMNPYYTTKKDGTGLGLPIVTKIINEHSGSFSLKNNKMATGTITTITLPQINA